MRGGYYHFPFLLGDILLGWVCLCRSLQLHPGGVRGGLCGYGVVIGGCSVLMCWLFCKSVCLVCASWGRDLVCGWAIAVWSGWAWYVYVGKWVFVLVTRE